jgi:hypothetical protein
MMAKHDWETVNREVHEPEELSVDDVVEEIRVALFKLPESTFVEFTKAIDRADYNAVGEYIASAFGRMSDND